MRREKQRLDQEEMNKVLRKASHGILALNAQPVPYQIPLNFVWKQDRIYFHCARQGEKLDAIKKDPRASFCIVGQDEIVPERFTSKYQSVIVIGQIESVIDQEEKRQVLLDLCKKYCAQVDPEKWNQYIANGIDACTILQFNIETYSGKEGSLLAKERKESKAE